MAITRSSWENGLNGRESAIKSSLATKFGFVKGSKSYEVDSSASYCKKACAESLSLLGIDSIDLCKPSPLPKTRGKDWSSLIIHTAIMSNDRLILLWLSTGDTMFGITLCLLF